MNSNQKIAVLGCGHWGKNLIRNLAALNSLAAVCDTNSESADHFSTQFNVSALSWDALLSDVSIDGVMIAAPSLLHADYAAQALQAGKHVFVEKPLALSKSESENLIQLAEQNRKVLMVGHLLHYHPAFLKLLDCIKDNQIGTMRSIETRRLGRGPLRINDNALWDLASHDVSMVLAACNAMPDQIAASGNAIIDANQTTSVPFITDAHIDLKFDRLHAHIHASWMAAEKEHKFIALGDKGALVFDDSKDWDQKLALHRFALTAKGPRWNIDSTAIEYIALEQGEPLKNECLHFLDCIKNNTAPRTDGHEALRVVTIIETAQQKIMEFAA